MIRIVGLFDNFEHNLSSYIKEFFILEEGIVKDTFHNQNHHFSKIIIRKASEVNQKTLMQNHYSICQTLLCF